MRQARLYTDASATSRCDYRATTSGYGRQRTANSACTRIEEIRNTGRRQFPRTGMSRRRAFIAEMLQRHEADEARRRRAAANERKARFSNGRRRR